MKNLKRNLSKKKYVYEKWSKPIKKSDIKSIYKNVVDLVNNKKVFRINDNEVITAVPLTQFLDDSNNNKLNTRDEAIKYFLGRIYSEYESTLSLIKDGDVEEIKNPYNRVNNMIYKFDEKQGQELKILTPKQMIIRLPILLSQLKAGNNSEKLKNEIRQTVYSLYRSQNLSKTIYNNLVNAI